MAQRYILPFALYLLGTSFAAEFPAAYPVLYAIVVLVVSGVGIWLLRGQQILRPHRHVGIATGVGLVGIALWIVLSELRLEAWLANYLPSSLAPAERTGFNPFELSSPVATWAFITIRLVGLSLVVPLIEEVFWRGFLLRWFIAQNWEEVPLGTYETRSFVLVTLCFTLAHPEWFAAASYCVLLNGLLYWKRDLWACTVAHAVSNFVLGIYVLATGSWHLW